ncbi:enoyl-CoA hydratase/carnithine racemase [Zhongshania antarctica]|uniref:Enoyl-CoA hydratase/carnithine racemase n=1 Tax=Zhongshania antarctica TaxID=641702 RepID=A0A840R4L6_9GAMM|nr:crotonase/enoyl-CoA hydratase family protein [Zhongshania antarctica]MBB5187483.1 enoyl-CoA hydratase/carnithine racemase [Zhongshania antarctica]
MTPINKVIIEERGQVLLIGLNRPEKYNAFDHDTWHEVARAYKLLESSSNLHCGLVYANGKHFTAGLDLPEWTDVFSSGEWPAIPPDECDPLGLRPEHRCRKPIVMAIHGICYTIGIELALGAEVRICGRGTRFGQIEVRRGIMACGGATVRMVQEFGYANAQRYLLTGDEFDAETALRIGMVQEVVDDDKVFDAGLSLAKNIAAQAPLAVQASLDSSRNYLLNGLDECADLVAREVPLMQSEDAAEGVASFKERRQAVFKGR